MRFKPKPNDILSMFGERYVVQPLPSAPHIPYSSEGGRAFVYQLKDQKGDYFALKVFKRKFRGAGLVDSTQHLAQIEKFEGLRAASRRVLPPGAAIIEKHPDLVYAMLMPWISGSTWFDVLVNARDKGTYFNSEFAVKLSAQFLKVMAALEQEGYAHSDISQGNLIIGQQQPEVELLDLEDMYLPGAPPPAQDYRGSPGYRHRSGDQGATTWCSEGDRYATAVMAAEMLLLTNQKAARLATDTGYFQNHCQDPVGQERFEAAKDTLRNIAPGFTELFQKAWHSESLGDCPKIADLREAINETTAKTITIDVAPPPEVPGVVWEKQNGNQPTQTVVIDPPQAPPASSRTKQAPEGFWSSGPASTPPPEPQPATMQPPPSSQPEIWVIVIAIVVLILLLVWFFSGSGQQTQGNSTAPEPSPTSQLSVADSSNQKGIPASPKPKPTIAAQSEQGATSNEDALIIQTIDGDWQFSIGNLDSALTIKSGVGEFVSESLYVVEQEVSAVAPPGGLKGILLKGETPVLGGTRIRPSGYAADEILIQWRPDGSFKAWDRDNVNVKRWEVLTVKSFNPAPDWEGPESDYLTARNIAGNWQFSNFSVKRYAASLVFRKGRGVFTTQTSLNVTQQARAEVAGQGILVRCSNPTLSRENVRAPDFNPDMLFFQRQPGGAFKVWIRDGVSVKDWSPIRVKSHP
jgi:serine/threonine protein kinase